VSSDGLLVRLAHDVVHGTQVDVLNEVLWLLDIVSLRQDRTADEFAAMLIDYLKEWQRQLAACDLGSEECGALQQTARVQRALQLHEKKRAGPR